MAGKSLREQGITKDPEPRYVSAREVVLPFIKFPGVDVILGPEMRSTGEVMGIGRTMGMAFAKGQIASGTWVPATGRIFISLNDRDKPKMGTLAKDLVALGYELIATKGTCDAILSQGVPCEPIFKVNEGRPNIVDRTIDGDVHWIINTPLGQESKFDEQMIRRTALERGLPIMTTLAAAKAAVQALHAMEETPTVCTLQEYHEELAR